MPLYKVDIEKELNGEFWTNRYVVNYNTLAAAYEDSDFFVNVEAAIHLTSVTFTKVRVSDFVQNNDQFVVVPLNILGQRANPAQRLALFNVVRCDFGAGFGSPSRKYLRGVLTEADVNADDLDPTFRTFIQNTYVVPLVNKLAYVDVDGERFNIGSVWPNVAMRQLRRGSKRKQNPII